MGEVTAIQWCDHTFNPWIGCAKVDALCKHCYAEHATPTRKARSHGLELWGVNGTRQITSAANWRKPVAWNKQALQHFSETGERPRVFCASLADGFEDRPDLVAPRARLFDLIVACENLDWLLVTKRPENVLRMVPGHWRERFPRNVWMGTSIGDQATADARGEALRQIPAVVRFFSCEPLLRPIDFRQDWVRGLDGTEWEGTQATDRASLLECNHIDWVIVGGESGPGARPCNVEWIRSIVAQCKDAGVAVFVKQLGARYEDPINGVGGALCRPDPSVVSITRLRDRKGGDVAEFPDDLRVREFPATAASNAGGE